MNNFLVEIDYVIADFNILRNDRVIESELEPLQNQYGAVRSPGWVQLPHLPAILFSPGVEESFCCFVFFVDSILIL